MLDTVNLFCCHVVWTIGVSEEKTYPTLFQESANVCVRLRNKLTVCGVCCV